MSSGSPVLLVALAAAACLAWIAPVDAGAPKGVPRVGFLALGPRAGVSASYDAFREGLRDLGYVEGKNVIVEYRSADGLAGLADHVQELVRLPVDVILAPTAAVWAAKAGSGAVPVVFAFSGDPVDAGLVASFARPGRNMTGVTFFSLELAGRRLELLKEAAPAVSRVAVLAHPNHPGEHREFKATEAAARALRITLLHFPLRTASDLDNAFDRMLREGAEAIMAFPDPVTRASGRQIAEFAVKRKLPSVFGWREYVEAGGLLSYGPNLTESFKRTATYVDKILRGAKPADLPVEQPTKFELVINLRTAGALGLTLPPPILMEADHVIR
jgi:putative ABC transport system substrate-binding protein